MDIRKGTSRVVTLIPSSPMSAPSAVIYDATGEEVVGSADLTADPSAVNTTVSLDASSKTIFAVESTTGIVPGLTLLVSDDAWGSATSEVSAVEDGSVRLVDPLPDAPRAGATVKGLDVTVEIPTAATQTLGVGFVVEVTDADTAMQAEFAVVRFPMAGPCKAQHIREKIARGYPGEYQRDERFHERAAEKVNQAIRNRLMGSGKYLSRFWSEPALGPLRSAMITLVLSLEYGLREGGQDRGQYNSDAERDVEARKQELLASAQTYDGNGDGKIADTEKAPSRWRVEFLT